MLFKQVNLLKMYRAKVLLETAIKSSKWMLYTEAKINKNILLTPKRYYAAPTSIEAFPTGHSSQYIEDMYNAWLENPASVHAVSFYSK